MWSGFLIAREARSAPAGLALIWRQIPLAGAHLYEFARRGDERERQALREAFAARRKWRAAAL
jgi:hypothetical protein